MAAWLGIGVVTGMVMGRRGHDTFTWWLLGAVLGPLVILLAMNPRERGGGGTRRPVPGPPADGSPDQVWPARGEPMASAPPPRLTGTAAPTSHHHAAGRHPRSRPRPIHPTRQGRSGRRVAQQAGGAISAMRAGAPVPAKV
jgi:hypothetical protein